MKRKLVGILITLLMIAPAVSVVGYQNVEKPKVILSETANWPMFRHDLMHTGYSSTEAPDTNISLWFNITGYSLCPMGALIQSSPAIIDGKIITGSNDNNVYCLNVENGIEIWKFSTDEGIYSSPAVEDDKVFIGSNDGNIYCLDASNGSHLWNYTTGSLVKSSPAVADGLVYVGSSDNIVYCLNAIDGNLEWSFTTNGSVMSSPAVVDGQIFIGSDDGKIYCLDAINGNIDWFCQTGDVVRSSPTFSDGFIYIGSYDENLYCINAITGIEEWIFPVDDSILSSPAVANGNVYVATVNGTVYCLNAIDGSPGWEVSIGNFIGSSPSVADGKLYIGESWNGIYCLDAETGNEIWKYITGFYAGCDASPAIDDGRVYISSYDGNLYCFGEIIHSPDEPIITGPTGAGSEIKLNFTAVAAGHEEDQLYYMWDWGDGNITNWIGPVDSGIPVTNNHSWINNGDYEIRVKAKDINDNESDWSEPHNISIVPQLEFSNLQLGFIYLRTFFANNSYAYIYLLETLGVTVVLSDMGLSIEATATDAVDTVTFELIDLLWEDQINQEDDNSTDGFSAYFELSTGIFQITVYSYDENGTMIDIDKLDYLVFIDLTSGEESQQIGHIGRMRYRLRERIRDRLLHH